MTRQQPKRSYKGLIIFIAILVISGVLLGAAGSLRNPFTVLSELPSLVSTTGEDAAGGREMREAGEGRPDFGGGFEGGRQDQTALQWNQLGGVLFNVWFIAVIAAVVMVVRYGLSFVIGRLRPSKPNPPPAGGDIASAMSL